MDSSSSALAPGQLPPLSVITPTDQGGVILIVTALCMIFSLISILIRVYVRLQLRHTIMRDDVMVSASMIFSIIQSSIVFVAVTKGYGKTLGDISPSNVVQLQKAVYASNLLYVFTLWLAKLSVGLLLLRLSSDKRHNLVSKVILLAAALLAVVSIFTVALQCDLASPWIFISAKCSNLLVRWQVIAAFDIMTELALIANSIYLVHELQVPLRKKTVVVLAFALRLPLMAPIILRLRYLDLEFSSPDPTLTAALVSVCTQIETSYSIISATIPCLRPFMSSLNTHYGGPAKPKSNNGGGTTTTGTGSNNVVLSTLVKGIRGGGDITTSTTAAAVVAKQVEEGGGERWGDTAGNITLVTSGEKNSMDSHESKQMIITKDIQWKVEYEGQSGSLTPGATNR